MKTNKEEEKSICNVPFIGELVDNNFNIPDNILDAYYSIIPQPNSINDVDKCYVGEINHYNRPYINCVYGAYIFQTAWEILEIKMNSVNDERGYYTNYTEERVYEALKNYAKGFQYGFDNFLNNKVNTTTLLSNSDELKAQKIIDFLSTPFNRPTFSESHGGNRDIFENWYNDGIKAGYYYCAWYLILENHKLFEPFLKFDTDPQHSETNNNQIEKPIKTFPEYILHEKNNEFAELLKDEFKIEIGKSLKLMIDVLIKKGMFTIENRQRQNIYNAMKKYFNRDIGTKQSIFDYKYVPVGNPDFESFELRIDNLLVRLNKLK